MNDISLESLKEQQKDYRKKIGAKDVTGQAHRDARSKLDHINTLIEFHENMDWSRNDNSYLLDLVAHFDEQTKETHSQYNISTKEEYELQTLEQEILRNQTNIINLQEQIMHTEKIQKQNQINIIDLQKQIMQTEKVQKKNLKKISDLREKRAHLETSNLERESYISTEIRDKLQIMDLYLHWPAASTVETAPVVKAAAPEKEVLPKPDPDYAAVIMARGRTTGKRYLKQHGYDVSDL